MKIYKFYTEQLLEIPISEAWDFFSSPTNLAIITPPKMDFRIINISTGDKMFPGMIIEYIVKPLWSIPMRWVTEITQVKEHDYFIDEQRFGPYKFWHHRHKFVDEDGKTKMIDEIFYSLPFGFIGRLAHVLFVKKNIEEIFKYRTKVISELFNNKY